MKNLTLADAPEWDRSINEPVVSSGSMSERALLGRIQELEPFAAESEARQALVATLMVLGSMLARDELVALVRVLPAELGGLLQASLPNSSRDWYTFSRRVADAEGVRLGVAIEHSEAVCRALSEELPREARLRLQRSLPTLAALFEVPERDQSPSASSRLSAIAPNDLAEGRPGRTLPIATPDPRYLAHRHSMARPDAPHEPNDMEARGDR